ncbi:hypothetical protein BDM02DRAFT_3188932 [Thelephora ganbajun]|uniref:Uncharacterized protein n=1 Tax=Thelephora ganbajun TaxID=370292 RepID=A0ACB6Z9Q7_THEGA|nr:hypothetical protein BDM02DRAFT_3188932 [Thelephora ganbajun]
MVSQCVMLEHFGVFLVLGQALVPSSPGAANASQTPRKLSGNKGAQFFAVGNLGSRALIIFVKKNEVLEPVIGRINEKTKARPSIGSRFGLRSQRSEWLRDLFLPSDSYDLLFLKPEVVILCSKGFNIMDLRSVIIPQKEGPRLGKLAERCESCRPMGIFRSNRDEFLFCYDEFGLYVDKHGDPSRRIGTVEWEETAERVSWNPPTSSFSTTNSSKSYT